MLRGDELVVSAKIESAITDLDGRPRRVPEQFVELFGPTPTS